jgi:hypothetical protein
MRVKRGLRLRDRKDGRVITVKRKASGNGHWQCDCGSRKQHKIHEGTLRKYFEVIGCS